MARNRYGKCRCNEFIRVEDKHHLLTDHHPECPSFNPATELYGLEMQCRRFMGTIQELKDKVKELKNKLNEVDSILEK